ncbi:hypothetical protein MMC24_006289 [Lignoscripta atroalba]|nr:hypothetical protein [Lignoscripta atroalba]
MHGPQIRLTYHRQSFYNNNHRKTPHNNATPMTRLPYQLSQLLSRRIPTLFGPQQLPSYIINFTKGIFFGHLFIEYVGAIKETRGPSMLPTLSAHGDWVYVSKLFRRGKGIAVGDVVTVRHPMFPWMGASKRVLGMPGDFVIRGTPGGGSGGEGEQMMVQVPEGHCWLAGDNAAFSRDSRDYGPLPLALVKGKVIARVWPLWEFKWIGSTFHPI